MKKLPQISKVSQQHIFPNDTIVGTRTDAKLNLYTFFLLLNVFITFLLNVTSFYIERNAYLPMDI